MTSTAIKTDAYELDWLSYLFNGTAMSGLSHTPDNTGTLYLCLFTADPRALNTAMPSIDGIGTLEPLSTEYTSYARKSVSANSTEWTCSTATGTSTVKKVTNDAVFAASTGGTGCLVTWIGVSRLDVGYASHHLLYAWQLVDPITVTTGIAPRIAVNDLVHEQK